MGRPRRCDEPALASLSRLHTYASSDPAHASASRVGGPLNPCVLLGAMTQPYDMALACKVGLRVKPSSLAGRWTATGNSRDLR